MRYTRRQGTGIPTWPPAELSHVVRVVRALRDRFKSAYVSWETKDDSAAATTHPVSVEATLIHERVWRVVVRDLPTPDHEEARTLVTSLGAEPLVTIELVLREPPVARACQIL